MSELQISLLVIGVVGVLLLYAFSWRQQRQQRRKFGATFKSQHEDVLYQYASEDSVKEHSATELLTEDMEQAEPATPLSVSTTGRETTNPISPLRKQAADDVCALLDAATDYVVVLTPGKPAVGDALAHLWQQRFDFGQNVHVCGLNAATGSWEKVLAEGRAPYSTFKLGLQLVNRTGAISEAKLAEFRDLARLIATQTQADAVLPDVGQAAAYAQQLDKFCATVDQIIGLNIFLSGERSLSGDEVAQVAGQHGFSLQADGTFHLLNELGHTLFTLINANNMPFQHHTMEPLQIAGLTLLLDLPRVQQPAQHFDQMAALARQLANDLHAVVADDRREALGEASIALIHEQIAAVEAVMLAERIIPGSAQARRLFS